MHFIPYQAEYFEACMALFDENCPAYFAENEKEDYATYLKANQDTYMVLQNTEGAVVAAYGLAYIEEMNRARVTWIMVSPTGQRAGLGRQMMAAVIGGARELKVDAIDIATSQHADQFFAKFGAIEIRNIKDGWGKGMHRIDMELKL